MDIVLGIAPWSHAETYPPSLGRSNRLSGKFGMLGGATPPLSLLYLSSSLKQAGHTTRFVDGFFHRGGEFDGLVLQGRPDVVGLWCSQFSWERTKALATRLKQAHPRVTIVVGGTYVTARGRVCLEEPDAGGVDVLILRDGEDAMVELCQVLSGQRHPREVLGLIFREAGAVVENEPRPYRQDLDALPFPDYDLLDIGEYSPAIGSYKCLPSVNMMTVRGCAGKCAFCHAASSLRSRSVGNVIEEIRWLKGRYGVRHLLFFDETFTWERERVVEICRRLDEARLRIAWTCNSRVDTIDGGLLDLMRQAGCWRVQYGGESGVQRNLDTLHKGVTPDQIRRAIELTRRAGLDSFVSFILGIPGETYEEGLQTIRFARSLPADYVNFLNFIPLEGSQLSKTLDQHGRMVGPTAFHRIAYVPNSMSHEQLADLMVRSVKSYYMRPGYILRRFFKQRSIEDIKRNLRGFLAFVRMDPKRDYLSQR